MTQSHQQRKPKSKSTAPLWYLFDFRTKEGCAAFADSYYNHAINIVRKTGRASTSHFQRQLCIGYRAATLLMDELKRHGVLSQKRLGHPARAINLKEKN